MLNVNPDLRLSAEEIL